MSNNNLISNRPMTSCMKIDGSMDLHNLTSLHDDSCELTFREKQSGGPGIYNLNQYRECEAGIPGVIDCASANPEIQFRDGYGVSEFFVDEDSELRVGQTRKNPKCPNQLFTRPYATVPYMGRGSGNSFLESQLRPGEATAEKKHTDAIKEWENEHPNWNESEEQTQEYLNFVKSIIENIDETGEKKIIKNISKQVHIKDVKE